MIRYQVCLHVSVIIDQANQVSISAVTYQFACRLISKVLPINKMALLSYLALPSFSHLYKKPTNHLENTNFVSSIAFV
jgi:hypothetical protein